MRAGEQETPHAPAQGFTYLALLWWVAISGVMLAALGQQWTLQSRRAREEEMAFRGEQVVQALRSYQRATPQGMPTLPRRLEELLEDQRSGTRTLRHLRRLWNDPVTAGPWGLLLDGGERIRGVYSLARGEPLTGPIGTQTYREWVFEVPPAAPPSASSPASPTVDPQPSRESL